MFVQILPQINFCSKFILIGTHGLPWYIAWFEQVSKIAQNRNIYPRVVLAMFAYGGVRAMFLGLKFHVKAIFGGLRFAI